jgi:hypothetical protein
MKLRICLALIAFPMVTFVTSTSSNEPRKVSMLWVTPGRLSPPEEIVREAIEKIAVQVSYLHHGP